MDKNILKRSAAAAAAAVLMCAGFGSCADRGGNDSSESSSSAVTAAPKVTLAEESAAESSQTDDASSAESAESEAEAEPASTEYTPAMWLVTSPEGNTMYMMGSMHALREECYPLPDYVQDAYDQADVLAVECDISNPTSSFSAGIKQIQNLNYDDGTTLKDHMSEELYKDISSYLTAHGQDISLYETSQLWYLSSVLDNISLEDADLDAALGFDINLLTDAHDDGKEIYEVESVSFQVDLLLGFSDEIYQALLEGYNEENAELITEQYEELYTAWRTGDLDKLQELNESEDEELTEEEKAVIADYNKQMLTDRNVGMAEKAKELMADGKNVFYVVGAAHFVGEGGIIDLMENEGYTFELVK